MERNKDFRIEKPSSHGKLIEAGFVEKDGMYRLWPHKLRGEGHFAVRFVKESLNDEEDSLYKRKPVENLAKKADLKYFEEFNFGLKTNVDLAGEARTVGLLYDANIK